MINYTLPLDELPDPLPIEPLSKPFDVTITPPGSKSITNRAYVLAALAEGESRIIRPLRADDANLLLEALCTLGAKARWDGDDVLITGVNGRFPRGGEVNLGDGGTPTRFMVACACLAAEPVMVDGSKRMRERPIAEGVDMLRQLGAKIEYVEEEGRLPVRVVPSQEFEGGEITIGKTQSSQFISALMLIGPWLDHGIELRFTQPPPSATYVVLTQHVLARWRPDLLPAVVEGSAKRQYWGGLDGLLSNVVKITPGAMRGPVFAVEPDASSAAYWFVAAWLNPPSRIIADRFGSPPVQSDLRVLLELQSSNLIDLAYSMFDREQGFVWEVTRGRNTGRLRCDCSLFPDGALALVAGAAVKRGKSNFTGLHTLRVKETDRIAALANELRKVGCTVETTEDSITIHPIPRDRDGNLILPGDAASEEQGDEDADRASPRAGLEARRPPASSSLRSSDAASPIIIETYNDHRMAMAFAVLGLRVPGIHIRNPAVVSKSYPGFWKDFAKLYR